MTKKLGSGIVSKRTYHGWSDRGLIERPGEWWKGYDMGSQKTQGSSWRKITVRFYHFEFDLAIRKGPNPEGSLEAMY